jgi:hypothetical protein
VNGRRRGPRERTSTNHLRTVADGYEFCLVESVELRFDDDAFDRVAAPGAALTPWALPTMVMLLSTARRAADLRPWYRVSTNLGPSVSGPRTKRFANVPADSVLSVFGPLRLVLVTASD